MEDGQQHQAIAGGVDANVTMDADAGSEGIAEVPTAEVVAMPATGASTVVLADEASHAPPPMMGSSQSRPWQPTAVSPARERPGFLARPFAPVGAALIAICCYALVGITYSITLLTGGDWTRGAQVAAYAAFALALLALAGGAVRYATGRRAFVMVLLGLLLAVTLAGTGMAGLLMAPGLHRTQARVLEQSGRYAAAIAEYALAGDKAPNAPDTARTYDEWAANLLRQRQYAAALSRYLLVTATYPGAGTPYTQAEEGIFATYTAWIATNGSGVPYPDAIAYIQSYAKSAVCDTTCQNRVSAIMPQAAYQFGIQLTAAGQYAAAIKQLTTVKAQYPTSPYASQAHAAAAVAYLNLGKQQLPTDCGAAVKTYQTLTGQYADTPQGAQAKQALAVPRPVSGTISQVPTNPAPTIYLSRSADTISYYFSDDFHTSVNAQSGVFSFASVPVGSYYLSAVRDTADGTQTTWWNAPDGSIYTVQVSPLCGAQLGTFPFA